MRDISKSIKVKRITPENGHFFFGYYDISPESPDGKKVLINKATFIDRMPEIDDELEVGYVCSDTYKYIPIGKTTAWNFQEGCRLQWLDSNRCIYNIRKGAGFHSVVYDTNAAKKIREYDVPIYAVSMDAGKAIFYSFTNNKYSYAHRLGDKKNDPYTDGIYILDLEKGKYHRLISNKEIDKLLKTDARGYFEYCVFNPCGDRFYFFYRWDDADGDGHTFVGVSDLNGKIERLLDSNFISHAGWRGNDCVTAWGRMPNRINAVQGNRFLRRTGIWKVGVKLFHILVKNNRSRQVFTNDSYLLFNLNNHSINKIEQVDFTSDGHETWTRDGRIMLTDSYPDVDDRRSLMLYNSEKDEVYLLGCFYSYPFGMKKLNRDWNISGLRCDLHPKWGYGEKNIYFDSVHEGYRGLYQIDISEIVGKVYD